MADIDEKVMAAVEAALAKNPSASVGELFEMARGVRPEIGELTKRQFHARYPLQVKRRQSKPKRGGRRKGARGRKRPSRRDGSVREAVRATFLAFASDLAAAEARKDVVRVVAGVDEYVDRVLKDTGAA